MYDIFETLGESNDYNGAIEKLTEYFSSQKNTEHQILMFSKCYQWQSETLDQFQTRLQMLAKDCEFHDRNNEVKRQIIQACNSSQLRRSALEMTPEECTLTKILAIGRRMEVAKWDGGNFHHDGGIENSYCKAKTVTCYSCGKQGHYAKYCLRKKNQQAVPVKAKWIKNIFKEDKPDILLVKRKRRKSVWKWNEKCLFSNTQEFLHNILVTWFK